MLADATKHIQHYLGVALISVILFFGADALLSRHHDVFHGNQVVITQPTAAPGAAAILGRLADAVKEKTLTDALAGRMAALSAAQGTVASTISSVTGANAQLAGALAEGLTRPSPKQQVITVAIKPTAATSAATPAPDDSAIKRDLKDVLNDPSTKVHVDQTVTVAWQDKPFSPIFAAYTGTASGAGYTLHSTRLMDLDALLLKTKDGALAPGIGLEHKIAHTSAGIGLDVNFNTRTHAFAPGVYAAVHL